MHVDLLLKTIFCSRKNKTKIMKRIMILILNEWHAYAYNSYSKPVLSHLSSINYWLPRAYNALNKCMSSYKAERRCRRNKAKKRTMKMYKENKTKEIE